MGLSQALSAALAGVNVTQQSLSVIAGNVANANTPGYVDESAQSESRPRSPASPASASIRRHQPQSQYAAAKPVMDGDVRRLLRGHDGATLPAASADLRHARIVDLVRCDLQQFHDRAAIALEQSRCVFRASPGGRCRAGADAKSQRDDASIQQLRTAGRAGHRQRRANGQYGLATDRPDQSAACSGTAGQHTATLEDQRDQAITQLSPDDECHGGQGLQQPDFRFSPGPDSSSCRASRPRSSHSTMPEP